MRTKSSVMKQLEAISGEELSLGMFMRAIREGEEMTQTEFSRLLDISSQQLSDIENGRRIVTPKKAIIYAEKLGYSQEQFLRLCLQDLLKREGVNADINVSKAA